MKKQLLMAVGVLFLAASAQAATITFRDTIVFGPNGANLNANSDATRSMEGSFNITPGGSGGDSVTIRSGYADAGTIYNDVDGFVVGSHTATSGFVSFYFRDQQDTNPETYRVDLDIALFNTTGTVINKSVTFLQIGANADILASINADGKLEFKVTATEGTFFFDYARLDVAAQSVPDGGATAALLGLAMFGVAAARSKLQLS